MIRQIYPFLSVLIFLIIQGCSSSRYHTVTPYHQKPESRQVIEQIDRQGTTEQRPAPLPKDSIVEGISKQAKQLLRNGELDAAAQTLERGIRIAPKNEFLWSQLAAVRLQQHQYGQAQSLAAKSSILAKDNVAIISINQAIIEEARKTAREVQ
jgi:predicted Zn-dependent protease